MQPARAKTFPFLKLLGELRNRVYGFLLTDTHVSRDLVESVILVNDLQRCDARRITARAFPMSTGQFHKSAKLAKNFHMHHPGSIFIARMSKLISGLPPLFETAILRACHPTHSEGTGVMFGKNTFAIMVSIMSRNDDLHLWFPKGLDLSRVCHLRLEYELEHIAGKTQGFSSAEQSYGSTTSWAFLRRMTSSQTLRTVVTFLELSTAAREKEKFGCLWHTTRLYRQLMQELVAAISKGIEVKMGLTKEENVQVDHGGFYPVRASVLRNIFETYRGIQGADVDMLDAK